MRTNYKGIAAVALTAGLAFGATAATAPNIASKAPVSTVSYSNVNGIKANVGQKSYVNGIKTSVAQKSNVNGISFKVEKKSNVNGI